MGGNVGSVLPGGCGDPPLTHRDPGVQAQQLHQRVVEDDGHQGHQDVGEAHVEDNGGPCGGEVGDGVWRGSGSPGSSTELSPGLG